MGIEIFFLNVCFFLFSLTILKQKEYKKSLFVFLIMIVTIFYTPFIYYVAFKQTSYRSFTDHDLRQYILIGGVIFLLYALLLLLCKQVYRIVLKDNYYNSKKNKKLIVRAYIFLVTAIVLGYVALYFTKFPLIYSIIYNDSILRPDTTGSIPKYFTFSAVMCLIIPSFYFYYYEHITKNIVLKLCLLLFLTIILVIGGNKGLLVYFYIFLWVYEYRCKVDKRVVIMFGVSIFIYNLLGSADKAVDNSNFFIMLISPLRRFFVTQGAMLINRINMMNIDFNFGNSVDISKSVYEYVYNSSIGSAPTYFLGDLMVKYGVIGGFIFHLVVIIIVFLLSNVIDANYKNNLFVNWSFYSALYLIGMSEISIKYLYRILAIMLNFIIIVCLDKECLKRDFGAERLT